MLLWLWWRRCLCIRSSLFWTCFSSQCFRSTAESSFFLFVTLQCSRLLLHHAFLCYHPILLEQSSSEHTICTILSQTAEEINFQLTLSHFSLDLIGVAIFSYILRFLKRQCYARYIRITHLYGLYMYILSIVSKHLYCTSHSLDLSACLPVWTFISLLWNCWKSVILGSM